MLHIDSLPYLKVVQLRSFSEIFFSSAPSLMPDEFHMATAMNAANHSTALLSALLRPPAKCLLTCVQQVDREEGVCVREFLRSTPHGYHDQIDNRRYRQEALWKRQPGALFTRKIEAFQPD
jgi:hypothetical protein